MNIAFYFTIFLLVVGVVLTVYYAYQSKAGMKKWESSQHELIEARLEHLKTQKEFLEFMDLVENQNANN